MVPPTRGLWFPLKQGIKWASPPILPLSEATTCSVRKHSFQGGPEQSRAFRKGSGIVVLWPLAQLLWSLLLTALSAPWFWARKDGPLRSCVHVCGVCVCVLITWLLFTCILNKGSALLKSPNKKAGKRRGEKLKGLLRERESPYQTFNSWVSLSIYTLALLFSHCMSNVFPSFLHPLLL